jgi:hypothetical protein
MSLLLLGRKSVGGIFVCIMFQFGGIRVVQTISWEGNYEIFLIKSILYGKMYKVENLLEKIDSVVQPDVLFCVMVTIRIRQSRRFVKNQNYESFTLLISDRVVWLSVETDTRPNLILEVSIRPKDKALMKDQGQGQQIL